MAQKMILELLARAASWFVSQDEPHVQSTSVSISGEPEDVTPPWREAANQIQAFLDGWHTHDTQKDPEKEAV